MRTAAKVDKNAPEIVRRLRLIGCSVTVLNGAGDGFPDLAVGFRRENWLFEVKDPAKPKSKRRLTPAQEKWHAEWRGQAHVIETFEDALRVMNLLPPK